MADEEDVEEGAAPEEEQPTEEQEAEQPSKSRRMLAARNRGKVKPDVWTALLVVAFVAFFFGIILAGNELHDYYDVQFWLFGKK